MQPVTSFGLRVMHPRDPAEPNRGSSPLEAFVDLVFVVAVSMASGRLHELESAGALGAGVLAYLMVFFAVWWAWMNFTWFATAFDTDDWLFRVTAIVQMAGALVMAAGTPAAMLEGDFTIVVVGYVVMRVAMIAQWLRAAVQAPAYRRTALGYAIGIAVVQVCWVAALAFDVGRWPWAYALLAAMELLVPVVAQRAGELPRNAAHMSERLGLFTLIVLGESVLASTNAVVGAFDGEAAPARLLVIAACGLVMATGMWWVYFSRDRTKHLGTARRSIRFSYLHYLVFAAAGAFSAGIEVAVDAAAGATSLSPTAVGAMTAVPVAVFLFGTWLFTLRVELPRWANALLVVVIAGVALSSALDATLVATAVLVVLVVVVIEVAPWRDADDVEASGAPIARG